MVRAYPPTEQPSWEPEISPSQSAFFEDDCPFSCFFMGDVGFLEGNLSHLWRCFFQKNIFSQVTLGATTLVPDHFHFEICFQTFDLRDTYHVRQSTIAVRSELTSRQWTPPSTLMSICWLIRDYPMHWSCSIIYDQFRKTRHNGRHTGICTVQGMTYIIYIDYIDISSKQDTYVVIQSSPIHTVK